VVKRLLAYPCSLAALSLIVNRNLSLDDDLQGHIPRTTTIDIDSNDTSSLRSATASCSRGDPHGKEVREAAWNIIIDLASVAAYPSLN